MAFANFVKLEKFKRLGDFLPWIDYDKETGIFLLDENHIGVAFMAAPLSGFDPTLENRFSSLLTSELPEKSFLGFNLLVFDDVSEHLTSFMNARRGSSSELITRASHNTVKFIADAASNPSNDHPVRNGNLIIWLKVPIGDAFPSDDELIEMQRYKREIFENLTSIGFSDLQALNDIELTHQLSILFNRGQTAAWRKGRMRPEPKRFIRDQVLDHDSLVNIQRDCIKIGDTVVSPLSAKRMPTSTYFGIGSRFSFDPMGRSNGIPCAHMISAIIKIQDISQEKSPLQRKLQVAQHHASGPLAHRIPFFAERANDLRTVDARITAGEFVHKVHFSVLLFSPSKEEAQKNVIKARTHLSELGIDCLVDTGIAFQSFRSVLPLSTEANDVDNLKRFRTMTSAPLATFCPLFFDWKGAKEPLVSAVGRSGQVVGVNPFDSATNFNFTISAESGAGKSFFANELISGILASGGKAWVIDVGRSYMNLCETFDGQFLEFSPESDICLNPFSSLKNQKEFDEVQDIILHLLVAMAAPKNGLDDFQMAALKGIVLDQFKLHGDKLIIDNIAEACLEAARDQAEGVSGEFKEKRLSDIAVGLQAFTSKGQYGRYFAREANIDFSKHFVVLELEELKNQKHLQQVVLLLLIYQIQQDMYLGDIDVRKLLLIDEAWDLLKDPQIAGFIEAGYRRFRKYNASAGIITQALTDLHDTTTGQAIVANSATTYMLQQKPDTLNALAKSDNGTYGQALCDRLKTVHTLPGQYSEIFIRTSFGMVIVRFIVDPYRRLVFSSHHSDKGMIKRYMEKGLSRLEAIKAALVERGETKWGK